MRVAVDNNVIIDALKPNPQFEIDAQKILQLASTKAIDCFVSANSLTDIFYVLRKSHGADKAKTMIQKLLLMFDIIGIEPADCVAALEKPMNDFEDALVIACAEKIGAEYVVTRDEVFLRTTSPVKLIMPHELLDKLK